MSEMHWIPVAERMPEEYKTIFAKFKGTDRWDTAMPERISKKVIVTVESPDKSRATLVAHTADGKWKVEYLTPLKVTAWMPLPDPYREDEDEID